MPINISRTCSAIIDEVRAAGHSFNVVYDIGCNDGRWTSKWGGKFPFASIYQFDANPENKPTNGTRYFNAALSDIDGQKSEFYLPNGKEFENTGASFYKEMTYQYTEEKCVKLETIKLDTLRSKHKIPKPQFIKIDTQGSELDIICGGRNTIAEAHLIMLEVPIMYYNRGAPNSGDYIGMMENLGFVATGVEHIAIRKGVFNQMDVVFMRKDLLQELYGYKERYTGF